MFYGNLFSEMTKPTDSVPVSIEKLKKALDEADAVVIGAGAGLSTAAGFTYSGERFRRYFADFADRYGFSDMYAGGFYPYRTPEEQWAYWSRHVFINRYMNAPKPVYNDLLSLVKYKDYFVLTTNVDHCFQKAGFDKKRLFYTQGDYGLWQCSVPCHNDTYDNEETVRAMVKAQGYTVGEDGALIPPVGSAPKRTVPSALAPHCPVCGRPMVMNLRADDHFVEDEGWHNTAERYENFLRTRGGKRLYLELGVGFNTPVIVKYPFWRMTANDPDATYACVNVGEALCPVDIQSRSICIDADIGDVLRKMR